MIFPYFYWNLDRHRSKQRFYQLAIFTFYAVYNSLTIALFMLHMCVCVCVCVCVCPSQLNHHEIKWEILDKVLITPEACGQHLLNE